MVAFSLSYTLGLIFGVHSVLRVAAQYKKVTVTRQSARFLLRNRMMTVVQNAMGSENAVVQSVGNEAGNILSMHNIPESTLFAAIQVSTSFLSLLILGYLGTALLTALFCRHFWTKVVFRYLNKIATFVAVILIDLTLGKLAGLTTRRG